MDNKKEEYLILLFAFVVLAVTYFFVDPSILGFAIYENETVEEISTFTYNSSLINVTDDIRLQAFVEEISFVENTTEEHMDFFLVNEAIYRKKDKTSLVTSLDDEYLVVKKNKVFNVTFDGFLDNSYDINIYLSGDDSQTIIKACDVADCSGLEYGSFDYDGSGGWVSIRLSNLTDPRSNFIIDPDRINVDYINASYTSFVFTNISENRSVITYSPASLETLDFEPENLSHWNTLVWNHTLNDQNIAYMYSIDSGLSWVNLTNNLLESINSTKLRFRVSLETNGTETPMLYSLILNYTTLFDVNETSEDNETSAPDGSSLPGGAPSSGGGGGGSTQTTFAEEGEAVLIETEETIKTKKEEKSLELVNPILSSEKENRPIEGAAVKDTEEGSDTRVFGYFLLVFVILILSLIYLFCFKMRRSKRSIKKK